MSGTGVEAAPAGERFGAQDEAGNGQVPRTDGGGSLREALEGPPAQRLGTAGPPLSLARGGSAPVRCGRLITAGRGPEPRGKPQGFRSGRRRP
jgi:hypothetical protein